MSRPLRLAIWSPLPPSCSGIADYVAETLPALSRHARLRIVVEDAQTVTQALPAETELCLPEHATENDIDVYHLGNSPAHRYVYRAALTRPGVVFLHEWNLHHLTLAETVEQGNTAAYLREMRRTYGERGSFLGRQISRALGGRMLPALHPLFLSPLSSALAVVGLTHYVCDRVRQAYPDRPVLHLPHHLAVPFTSPPGRLQARRELGLPEDAWIVTAPGLATAAKRLHAALRSFTRVRSSIARALFVVAGAEAPDLGLDETARDLELGPAVRRTGRLSLEDFVRHLAAADVVLALRFPSYGEISGALVRALGVGRPALVTAGTPAASEFPEGVVLPVTPGVREETHLAGLLLLLAGDPALCERIGHRARAHVLRRHDLAATVERLVRFLDEVRARKSALSRQLTTRHAPEGSLFEYLSDEIQWHMHDLGLSGFSFHQILKDIAGRNGR
ncbi:MAG: glycosyltransferase family 4 protein [Vicinamibacteria bacterium]|nr:glycosyltransferase family 4 protein [Vicinamibacteria bacterium]